MKLLEELDRIQGKLEQSFNESTMRLEQIKICRDKDGHLKQKCDIDKEEQVAQESKEMKSNLQVKHQTCSNKVPQSNVPKNCS
jgi:hypothetical protein